MQRARARPLVEAVLCGGATYLRLLLLLLLLLWSMKLSRVGYRLDNFRLRELRASTTSSSSSTSSLFFFFLCHSQYRISGGRLSGTVLGTGRL